MNWTVLGALAFIGVFIVAVVLWLKQRRMTGRLSQLTYELRQVAESSDLSGRLAEQGHGELDQLSESINWVLDSLLMSHQLSRGSEARLAAILNSNVDAILLTDAQRRILLFNEAAESVFRCTAAQAVGRSLKDFLPQIKMDPRDVELETDFMGRIMREAKLSALRLDGSVFPAEVSVSRKRHDDSEIFTVIVRDVTDRVSDRLALEDSEARFRTLVENAPEAILVIDESGQFIDANDNAVALFGMDRASLLKRTPIDLSPQFQRDGRSSKEAFELSFADALAGKNPVFEFDHVNTSGNEIICEVRLVWLPAAGQALIRASLIDITNRKRTEMVLQGQRRLLEQVAGGEPLDHVLEELALFIEGFSENEVVSILLADDASNTLRYAAGPNLPPDYRAALARVKIEPVAIACSAAAYTRNMVICEDIALDDGWGQTGQIAVAHGLRAVIAMPILSTADEILGVCELYQAMPHEPQPEQISLLEATVDIAGIAIERAKAEQRLAEERNLLRLVIDNLPDYIYAKDRDHRFVLNNQATSRFHGRTGPDGLVRTSDHDFYSPEMADHFKKIERSVIDDGKPLIEHEELVIDAAGDERWILTTKLPMRDANGNVAGLVGIGRDITDRKQADHALRQSEAGFRELFANNPHPMWVYDAETLAFLDVNEAAQDRYGYTREEFMALTIKDIRPEEDQQQLLEYVAQPRPALRNSGEWRHKIKDGTVIDVAITSHALQFAGRHASLVVAQDITVRKRAEEALRSSEEKYRSLIEQSNDLVYLLYEGRFELVNPRFEEVIGLTLEDLQQPDFELMSIIAPENREFIAARLSLSDAERLSLRSDRYEFSVLDRNQQPIAMDAAVSYFPYQNGVAIQGILRDITQRKQAEDAMRQLNVQLESRVAERTAEIHQQQQRTMAILDSVADAVVVLDLSGEVLLTNPVAQWLLQELPDANALIASVAGIVERLSVGQEPAYIEILEIDQFVFEAKAARVLESGDELGTVVVLHDITRLQELDRLKTQFVDTVSHELRTPLANIKLYLSLLQRGRQERQKDYMLVMSREVTRLERLISDLLDLSRLEKTQQVRRHEPVNMDSLLEQVVETIKVQADGKQVSLTLEPSPTPLPEVFGDRDQLVQMLTNLMGNAIFYTPDGESVTARIWPDQPPGTEEKQVVIEISDTGIGIADDDLPHIFDRFYRGDNVRTSQVPGTGLGLAITKEIVERHHGRIEVESELNRGSIFRVYLPVMVPHLRSLTGEVDSE